jgi:hypothetical protein
MASSTIQRINLADEDVATGDHGASPGDGTEPKLSGRGPDLLDVERIGLAGDRLAPNDNGNGISQDNVAERHFSTLSPDMTERAIWVAEQLRSSLEPNVVLERSQEVLNLIYERYKLLCRHIKLLIPPEIEQDFFKAVVDELVGFGPLKPLLNDDQKKMER